jgi:uncharacterized protein (TIGR02217 family)
MTFRNMRFPTGIRYGAMLSVNYSTAIARAVGGKSYRNKQWQYPLRKFTVDHALRDATLRAAMVKFFHNINGAGDSFRLKDHSDYAVGLTNSAATGVFTSLGNGQYRMFARYTSSSYSKDIPIYLPTQGTLNVYRSSTLLTESAVWSTDYTQPSGIITMLGSPTPAAPTSWTGEYDIEVALEDDEMPLMPDDEELYEIKRLVMGEQRGGAA